MQKKTKNKKQKGASVYFLPRLSCSFFITQFVIWGILIRKCLLRALFSIRKTHENSTNWIISSLIKNQSSWAKIRWCIKIFHKINVIIHIITWVYFKTAVYAHRRGFRCLKLEKCTGGSREGWSRVTSHCETSCEPDLYSDTPALIACAVSAAQQRREHSTCTN